MGAFHQRACGKESGEALDFGVTDLLGLETLRREVAEKAREARPLVSSGTRASSAAQRGDSLC